MAHLDTSPNSEIRWVPHVTMDPSVHLPSTWKGAVGKQLTNATIKKHQLAGWYGPEARKLALKEVKAKTGFVFRCGCGATEGVRYLSYSYLPRPGYLCPRCLAIHRAERDKDKELSRQLLERIKAEYV